MVFANSLARFADQISLDDFAKQRPQGFDAALFCPAADDPKHFVEGKQRLFGGIGVGRFRIVDEENLPFPANLLKPMRQSGETPQAFRNAFEIKPKRPKRRDRGGGILAIVLAAQRGNS